MKRRPDLSERTDILCKPADKGGSIVIMDPRALEIFKQLGDEMVYERLGRVPTFLPVKKKKN